MSALTMASPAQGQRVVGIELERALEVVDRGQGALLGEPGELGPSSEIAFVCGGIAGVMAIDPGPLLVAHSDCQRCADPPRDRILEREQILPRKIVVLAPEQRAVLCPQELHAHPEALARRFHRAIEHIVSSKGLGNHTDVRSLALVADDRAGGTHPELAHVGQAGDDRVRDTDAECSGLVALEQGTEWQDGDGGEPVRSIVVAQYQGINQIGSAAPEAAPERREPRLAGAGDAAASGGGRSAAPESDAG